MQSLKKLFRSTAPTILRDYFELNDASIPDDFDWALEEGKRANEIEKALTQLPDDLEDTLRAELEGVQELATEDGWIAIDQVCAGERIELPENEGAEGAAFFVVLNHPELLPKIVKAASMNRFNGGRQWGGFTLAGGSLTEDTTVDPLARGRFTDAILEARGFPKTRPYLSDWFSAIRRDPVTNDRNEITYLTLYLLDRPIKEMTVDENKRFLMALRQRVDEMIFAINPKRQEIEVYSKGGARVQEALAQEFCTSFVGSDATPVRIKPRLVDFGPLKRKPDFDISPDDRIESASVVKLKFWSDGLEGQYRHASDNNEIYDLLDYKLGTRSPLRNGDLMTAATLKIKRERQHGKTLTIDLGYPSRTTLPNQTAEDRALSVRLLERWGILGRDDPLIETAK